MRHIQVWIIVKQNQVQNLPCACCAHADSLCQQKLLCQCTFFSPLVQSQQEQEVRKFLLLQRTNWNTRTCCTLSDNLQPSSDFRPLLRHKLASSGLSPRDKQLFQDRPT